MGTLIVPVRKALMAAIAVLPEFTAAPVVETVYAYKVGSVARKRAWTTAAKFQHAPAGLRGVKTFRNEIGTFELWIRVEGVGLAPEDTAAQAVVLGAAVEDWIATKANWAVGTPLALLGVEWIEVEGAGQLVDFFNDLGSGADVVYPIRYSARLT